MERAQQDQKSIGPGYIVYQDSSDGLFECPCGRGRFTSPPSLHRHAKRCSGQAILMTEEDTSTAAEFNFEAEGTSESNSTEAEGIAASKPDGPGRNDVGWPREKLVRYLPEFEIVVCVGCGYGLNKPPGIRRHLVSRHMYDWKAAKKTEDGFQGLKIHSSPDPRLREPSPDDPPVPHLTLYKHGLGCHLCDHICLKDGSMLQHLRLAHDVRKPRQRMDRRKESQLWKEGLWVQTFFPSSGLHYFEVARNDNRNGKSTDDMNLTRGERFRQQLRATVERREMELRIDAESIQTSSIRTEVSLWQEKTRWIEQLSGCNLITIARLIELPEGDSGEDPRLHTICESLDRLLDGARKAVLDRKINYFDHNNHGRRASSIRK